MAERPFCLNNLCLSAIDLGYGELVARCYSGYIITEVSKAGHKVSPFLYFPVFNNHVVCGYKGNLVPANVPEVIKVQENRLQFQKIDVEFAFWYKTQTLGCEVSLVTP